MASSIAASTSGATSAASISSAVTRSWCGRDRHAVEAGQRIADGGIAARRARRRSAARSTPAAADRRWRRGRGRTARPDRRRPCRPSASIRITDVTTEQTVLDSSAAPAASVTARAGHRRRRGSVGRRGQGQGHRPARQGARVRRALPGWPQRRAHRRCRRRALRPAAHAERDPLRPRHPGHRQRRRRRPADAVRRDRHADRPGHLVRPAPRVQPRPPHLPLAPGPRRHRRDDARRRQDRHDAQGHRSGLRRQGPPGRHPRRRRARSGRFAELVRARAIAENRQLTDDGAEALDVDEVVSTFDALGAAAGPVRHRHGQPAARRPGRPAPTCCSKAPRRRSSTSTTAPIRTSRRRTRPPAARAPAPGSARATSTASSGSPRRTRPGSVPGRSRPS